MSCIHAGCESKNILSFIIIKTTELHFAFTGRRLAVAATLPTVYMLAPPT